MMPLTNMVPITGGLGYGGGGEYVGLGRGGGLGGGKGGGYEGGYGGEGEASDGEKVVGLSVGYAGN